MKKRSKAIGDDDDDMGSKEIKEKDVGEANALGSSGQDHEVKEFSESRQPTEKVEKDSEMKDVSEKETPKPKKRIAPTLLSPDLSGQL